LISIGTNHGFYTKLFFPNEMLCAIPSIPVFAAFNQPDLLDGLLVHSIESETAARFCSLLPPKPKMEKVPIFFVEDEHGMIDLETLLPLRQFANPTAASASKIRSDNLPDTNRRDLF
jgi:hypothetical protein